MAQPKKIERTAEPSRPAPTVRAGNPAQPARALHQLLEERSLELAAPSQDVVRWSRRRALAFIVTSSAALWMAILTAVRAAVHAVA